MIGRAIVVGAGIAGLTAGYRLQQAGFDVTVLEAENYVGGRMSTVTRDGYVLDRGAGALTSQYTEMMALIGELGIADQLVGYSDEIGYLRDGRTHRIRARVPFDVLSTKLLGVRSKLLMTRIALDARRVAGKLDPYDLSKIVGVDNETVRQYADRRLTPEIRDYMLDPSMRFLFGGDLDDFASTEFFFLVLKYLSGKMMNARSGIDFLARALAARLDVRLGARVNVVEESPDEVRVSWEASGADETVETVDVCVIAVTATAMAKIYPQLDAERRAVVEALNYSPLWKIALGTSQAPKETATIVQFPSREVSDLTGVILEHHKGIGRAPDGKGLLSVYVTPQWCREHVDDDDERVGALAAHELDRIIPGVEDSVEMVNVSRWDTALLLAGVGTWSSLARFQAKTPRGGRVQFAGDYIASSSTNSALISGERAASILVDRTVSSRGGGLPVST
jgi:oxygen-dependent protoporphyrinogen oxidase